MSIPEQPGHFLETHTPVMMRMEQVQALRDADTETDTQK